jgi:hypothetical protein
MRNAQSLAHGARVLNIIPGAASPLALCRSAVIIQLQSNADDLCPAGSGECGHDRAINPARHGNNDAAFVRWARQIEQCRSLCWRQDRLRLGSKSGWSGHDSAVPLHSAARLSHNFY